MRNKLSTPAQQLLLSSLTNPHSVNTLSTTQWSLLLRMAKASKITAHLGWVLTQHQALANAPEKVTQHFKAAQIIADYRKRIAFWELNRLQRALTDCATDIIVLKGCAYLLADIAFAQTRVFADVDLMVEKSTIDAIEQRLLDQRWYSLKLNDYDQSYYRKWMHEIPPLRHVSRTMEVDIHHTIIPPTSDLQPDPALLRQDAISVDNSAYKILSPCDMVLHSAVHLFFDSDLSNKLRDLVDLDQLIRHFCTKDSAFLTTLLVRAAVLGLQRPLYYSLRYSQRLLQTPIPDDIIRDSQVFAPPATICWLMDHLIPRALLPEHPDESLRYVAFARWLLYIRSHYLRMPLKLLLPHLARKSLMRFNSTENTES
jgi:Uncharacterised nucleotidyltransferase